MEKHLGGFIGSFIVLVIVMAIRGHKDRFTTDENRIRFELGTIVAMLISGAFTLTEFLNLVGAVISELYRW